jgi:nucleoside-diphosphate-sugar epimerase
MNILVIGGNGFIGKYVVRQLKAAGHRVAVFHRGSKPFGEAEEIVGDRNRLDERAAQIGAFGPDAVIDMVLSSARQAEQLVSVLCGKTKRIVAISSMDVYRAAGVLHGTEPGDLQELPLTEESALRTKVNVYPPEAVKMLQGVFTWLDDEYDKVLVERALTAQAHTPVTILRLPMVYGPGDPLHRLFPLLKRMSDGRKKIILEEAQSRWRGPRGYVENVAQAIASAAMSTPSAHRVFNIAEEEYPTELEWAELVAKADGWKGEFVLLPKEKTPAHLIQPGNAAQHWVASSKKIRTQLGYSENVSRAEAMKRTIEWELANPPQIDQKQFDYAAEEAALAAT